MDSLSCAQGVPVCGGCRVGLRRPVTDITEKDASGLPGAMCRQIHSLAGLLIPLQGREPIDKAQQEQHCNGAA